MRRLLPILLVLVAVGFGWNWRQHAGTAAPDATSTPTHNTRTQANRLPAFLPAEARHTLALIARGGPFPYRHDGIVFQNREGHLPSEPRGYYHEYTVVTPGARTRGARRIITGGNPPQIYYYTADHYRSFRSFKVQP